MHSRLYLPALPRRAALCPNLGRRDDGGNPLICGSTSCAPPARKKYIKRKVITMEGYTEPVYKRVLLKLSGEALSGGDDGILNHDYIDEVCAVIADCASHGVQFGIVVGAGNIWRGKKGGGMERTLADHMGMLATAINALAIKSSFNRLGVDARVMSAVEMNGFAETYDRDTAVRYLEKGRPVIFACGMGVPFFSTDTAAVLRGAEICADVVLMAKNIDALYTDDPRKNPNAERLSSVTFDYILSNHLGAIDSTAASFANDNKMTVHMFGLDKSENIRRVIMGEAMGTVVK